MKNKIINVLLVEDDAADIELFNTAIKVGKIDFVVHSVEDGVEALEYLKHKNGTASPDMIILDLNLPRMNGQEFYEQLKKDPHLKNLPLVFFSTSEIPLDFMRKYAIDKKVFYKKPFRFSDYVAILKSIEQWYRTIKSHKV